MTEGDDQMSRKTKMHKWGIPLAVVIGIGVSVPAGTMATMKDQNLPYGGQSMNTYGNQHRDCAAWHEVSMVTGTDYSMNLGFLLSTFLIPAILLLFPLIALLMQVRILVHLCFIIS